MRTAALNLSRLTRLAGIVLILAVGLIHLVEAPGHFEVAGYLGVAFVVNFAGSWWSAFTGGSELGMAAGSLDRRWDIRSVPGVYRTLAEKPRDTYQSRQKL